MKKSRIDYFDIAKGFAILAVIMGHLEWSSQAFKTFIFSWHLPLFFLLAGYTFRVKPTTVMIKGSFKRLLVPYFIVCLFITIRLVPSMGVSIVPQNILAAFFGRALSSKDIVIVKSLQGVGSIWFLPAMFWCRVVYNWIARFRYKLVLSVLLAVFSTFVYHQHIALPLTFLEGLSALTFFAIGHFSHEYEQKISNYKYCLIPIGTACWFFQLIHPLISMAECHYVCYPVDVLGACFATWIIVQFSRFLQKIPIVSTVFLWIGVNSLLLLCVHNVECHAISYGRFEIAQDSFFLFIIRLAIVFCGSIPLLYIKYTRNVFGIKSLKEVGY